MTVLNDSYLLSVDGTQSYCSHKVRCPSCCVKNHRNGTTSYYHQLLGGALVHPDSKTVFPVAPEMIHKHDGTTKNDCELNATARFIKGFRDDHRHLKTIILGDALAANGSTITLLQEHGLGFILGIRPVRHKYLFDWIGHDDDVRSHTITRRRKKQTTKHHFRWHRKVPLNEANHDLRVHVLLYAEEVEGTKPRHWSWVTDQDITVHNVETAMRSARTRWKIENETFRVLKHGGYELEHNYGHGYKHLSHVMVHLAMLSLLIDQAVEKGCRMFARVRERHPVKTYLWEAMRSVFSLFYLDSWETLYRLLDEKRKAIEGHRILEEP